MEPLHTRRAGGIVLGDSGTIALVCHKNNSTWLFPKGHIDGDETDEETARREIEEETGIRDLELLDDLGSYERHKMHNDNTNDENEIASIHMYLFAAPVHAELAPTFEIGFAKWVPYREIADVIGNEKDRLWYATVFERVRQAIQRD